MDMYIRFRNRTALKASHLSLGPCASAMADAYHRKKT